MFRKYVIFMFKLYLILFLIVLTNSIQLLSKEEFVLDSVPSLYYGKIEKEKSYIVSSQYGRYSDTIFFEIDTLSNSSDKNDMEYYLFFSPNETNYILLRKIGDSTFSKYYAFAEESSYLNKPYLMVNDYNNLIFYLVEQLNDSLFFEIRKKSDVNFGRQLYSKTTAVKIASGEMQVADRLIQIQGGIVDVIPFEKYPNYYASIQYLNYPKNEFRLQGLLLNALKHQSADLTLSFSVPTFSFIKDNNDNYLVSAPLYFFPFALWGYLMAVPEFNPEDSVQKAGSPNALFFMGVFLTGFYSLLNFGVDIPILKTEHYLSLSFKLNSDILATKNDSLNSMYVEPKLGFRYIYNGKFGFEMLAGYRLWAKEPSVAKDEKAFFALSLLLPLHRFNH